MTTRSVNRVLFRLWLVFSIGWTAWFAFGVWQERQHASRAMALSDASVVAAKAALANAASQAGSEAQATLSTAGESVARNQILLLEAIEARRHVAQLEELLIAGLLAGLLVWAAAYWIIRGAMPRSAATATFDRGE